ncbi:MAG: hypothetical protein J6S27_08310 [Thermoguttaceae bacterium]|nr:hypothetical protein [Thermoguttaceae bacterium]MBR2586437.1 hypothetical protein [Thermoguttaceae bacterium]
MRNTDDEQGKRQDRRDGKKGSGWLFWGILLALVLFSHFRPDTRAALQNTGFQDYAPAVPAATAQVSRPLEVPDLYAFEHVLEGGIRQIVLVDSESKRICVYHIDLQGKIEFVANRNFEWDLKMEDFNGTGLTPGEIREAVQRSASSRTGQ